MFATVILILTINLLVIIVPMSNSKTQLTDYERYKLLSNEQKAEVRDALTYEGCSDATFYRWIRTRTMPNIWRKEFSKQIKLVTNAISEQ